MANAPMPTEERVLTTLAPRLVYPETPPLRASVLSAIAAEGAQASEPRFRRAVAFAGVLAAIALAIGAALAVPDSRSAIADFFGVEGSDVQRLPTSAPGATATPLPDALTIELFANPAPLVDVERALGFSPALPKGEQPNASYLVEFDADDAIAVLQYEDFDLWQTRAPGIFGKEVPQEAIIRELTINGNDAVWIGGGRHIVRYIGDDGVEAYGSERAVDRNTLIWRTDYAFYRLETSRPEAEAVEIAETLP